MEMLRLLCVLKCELIDRNVGYVNRATCGMDFLLAVKAETCCASFIDQCI